MAWLSGPNEYRARFGAISIPSFHARFAIDEAERDAWLLCMARAVDDQPWTEAFKFYGASPYLCGLRPGALREAEQRAPGMRGKSLGSASPPWRSSRNESRARVRR